jgi:DNA-binding protein HU-beta
LPGPTGFLPFGAMNHRKIHGIEAAREKTVYHAQNFWLQDLVVKLPQWDYIMSKAAFIERIAKKGALSRAEAKQTVELVFGEIEAGLKQSKKVGKYTIGTLGTFSVTKRPARKGRNPRTGEPIRIKASKNLKFKPFSSLKKAAGC